MAGSHVYNELQKVSINLFMAQYKLIGHYDSMQKAMNAI
jgi:hypothetical protein